MNSNSEKLELKDVQHGSIAERRKNTDGNEKIRRKNTGLAHSSNIYQVRK